MIAIRPSSRADMERRAAEVEAARRPSSGSSVRKPARNIAAILTLGDSTYFNFRGLPFGVPPVAWKAGEQLLALYLRAVDAVRLMADGASLARVGDPKLRAEYFAAIAALPPILWKLCRPVGRFRRFLRAVGLHRNPFASASERELLDLADFFLQRRTRSGVQYPPTLVPLDPATFSTRP